MLQKTHLQRKACQINWIKVFGDMDVFRDEDAETVGERVCFLLRMERRVKVFEEPAKSTAHILPGIFLCGIFLPPR